MKTVGFIFDGHWILTWREPITIIMMLALWNVLCNEMPPNKYEQAYEHWQKLNVMVVHSDLAVISEQTFRLVNILLHIHVCTTKPRLKFRFWTFDLYSFGYSVGVKINILSLVVLYFSHQMDMVCIRPNSNILSRVFGCMTSFFFGHVPAFGQFNAKSRRI